MKRIKVRIRILNRRPKSQSKFIYLRWDIDDGQDPTDPTHPLYGTKNYEYPVDSFEEASAVCQAYIRGNDLGSGNWSGGQVVNAYGQIIAAISYNGRVWAEENECFEHSRIDFLKERGLS